MKSRWHRIKPAVWRPYYLWKPRPEWKVLITKVQCTWHWAIWANGNIRKARGYEIDRLSDAKREAEAAWAEIEKELHGRTDNGGRDEHCVLADGQGVEGEEHGT